MMASDAMHSQLAAVYFCEFDNLVGRTLAYQEPAGFISTDAFDSISEFLIPKPQLCDQLIALREFGDLVLGKAGRVVLCWPMCLEDTRYARNALLFSIGFILEPCTSCSASERFGRVLEKAARHLGVLERETSLLSGGKREVQHLLLQLFHDLRSHGRCSVAVDASNTLELSLPPPPPPSGHGHGGAHEFTVPVLIAVPPPAAALGWCQHGQNALLGSGKARHRGCSARNSWFSAALHAREGHHATKPTHKGQGTATRPVRSC